MSSSGSDSDFPCSLDISVPFPSARLAAIALQTLQVDKELSPLVRRHIALANPPSASDSDSDPAPPATLDVRYRAATNRMLRVAVNSLLDSLRLAVHVMQCLDEDVLAAMDTLATDIDGIPGAVAA